MPRTRLATAFALLLGACASTAPHPPTIDELRGTWQIAAMIPPGARIPTLNIGIDGSISGSGAVNKFRGSIDPKALGDGIWRPNSLQPTTRMTGTADAMRLENEFFRGIAQADRAVLTGDELRLLRGESTLLVCGRVRFR